MATSIKAKSSVRVVLSLPSGLNEKGKQTRCYVQQIVGPNKDKVASANGQVYDWLIANADKPGSNFSKLGRTDADASGLFRVKYSVGDGIYRVVRPNVDKRTSDGRFVGWPETVFVKIANGQTSTLSQNEARAAVGLGPVAIKSSGKTYLEDSDDDISV